MKTLSLRIKLIVMVIHFLNSLLFSQQIVYMSDIPVPGGFVFDVWGYYDSTSGKEYAYVGSQEGVTVYDVTDPVNPIQLEFLPDIPGFDLKIYNQYLYTVTGSGGTNQATILDISDPASPLLVGRFNSAHNIYIEDGLLYAEYPGLLIYDLSADPLHPALIFNDGTQDGHDALVINNMLYDFHGNEGTKIYRVNSTPPASFELLSIIDISLISYHHSGWVTEDGKYLFICDELAQHPSPDVTVWDISDPTDPELVAQYADSTATIHNLYITGSYAYISHYSAGFKVLDVHNPAQPVVADAYDTDNITGEGFDGAFGCYPFLPSGNILISSQTGLWIFRFDSTAVSVGNNPVLPASTVLEQNYPNPFNPSTNIKILIADEEFYTLKIYSVTGEQVKELFSRSLTPGTYTYTWNGKNSDGIDVPSGIYFYRLQDKYGAEVKKMILLR